MIVYNITFHVAKEEEQEFVQWLRTHYLPRALATGDVAQPRLLRVMGRHNHDEGTSLALQLEASSLSTLQHWLLTVGNELNGDVTKRYAHRVAGFTTMLESIDLQ